MNSAIRPQKGDPRDVGMPRFGVGYGERTKAGGLQYASRLRAGVIVGWVDRIAFAHASEFQVIFTAGQSLKAVIAGLIPSSSKPTVKSSAMA